MDDVFSIMNTQRPSTSRWHPTNSRVAIESDTSPLATSTNPARSKYGNTLVTFCGSARIREYLPDGTKIWEHECGTSPFRAQRLENGSTIYGDADGLHVVNEAGVKEQIASDLDLGGYVYIHSF